MPVKEKRPANLVLTILGAICVLVTLACILLGVTGKIDGGYAYVGGFLAFIVATAIFKAAGINIDD